MVMSLILVIATQSMIFFAKRVQFNPFGVVPPTGTGSMMRPGLMIHTSGSPSNLQMAVPPVADDAKLPSRVAYLGLDPVADDDDSWKASFGPPVADDDDSWKAKLLSRFSPLTPQAVPPVADDDDDDSWKASIGNRVPPATIYDLKTSGLLNYWADSFMDSMEEKVAAVVSANTASRLRKDGLLAQPILPEDLPDEARVLHNMNVVVAGATSPFTNPESRIVKADLSKSNRARLARLLFWRKRLQVVGLVPEDLDV